MKYALVNDEKTEATKGTKGVCLSCGSELIAKCGDLKVHHWSHKGARNCDHWWENETEWHRSWKNNFPKDWQEVIHFDGVGEKHIADVRTQSGWVLEFQHSFLQSAERLSRNVFYQNLVWVVNGTRRKTDKAQFQKLLEESEKLQTNFPVIRVNFPDECRLINEWHNTPFVFFDFKESEDAESSMLWFLFPRTHSANAYLSPFSRAVLIELFNNNDFDEFLKSTIIPIHTAIRNEERKQQQVNSYNLASSLSGFGRRLRRGQRNQRRL